MMDDIRNAFGNRASRVQSQGSIGNEDGSVKAHIYDAIGYRIIVPVDVEQGIFLERKDRAWSTSRKDFPSLTAYDGEVRFSIEDMVDVVLAKIDPEELAVSLWAADEVRERFIYAASEYYSQSNVGDADRRKMLTKMQSAVHSKAIDDLVQTLNQIEEAKRSYTNHYRWEGYRCDHYKAVLESVAELGGSDLLDKIVRRHGSADMFTKSFENISDPAMRESVGKQWHESRDFWRSKLLEHFPGLWMTDPSPAPPQSPEPRRGARRRYRPRNIWREA